MNGFRDAFGRFVPPREWEVLVFGLAAFALFSVPVTWLLHGFSNVNGAWYSLPVAALLIGYGLRLRRKRIVNSQPFLSDEDDS